MSSATSIKRGVRLDADVTGSVTPEKTEAGFRPWHFFVLASLIAATAAVVLSRQSTPEHLVLISLTIGAAGVAAAGFYRMLAPLTVKDVSVFSEPLNERSRAALEREKMLALRSIKELEFDRAMGKVSAKDFDEMAGRLRTRAVALMKQLDEDERGGYRGVIERELSARLSKRDATSPSPGPSAVAVAQDGRCDSCGTTNDADALFCKRCGSKLHLAGAER
jgi:hypothetical protein